MAQRSTRTFLRLPLTAVAVLFVVLGAGVGCAHYRLGTGGQLAIETLYLPPVANTAAVPQATALVTREVRLALIRDGRVRLVESPDEADAVLQLTLEDYAREMTTTLASDTGRARKFDVTLRTRCVMTHQETGEVLLDRTIDSTRQIFTDDGQLAAEYQNLPQIAQLLANRVAHAVLDVW